MKLLLLIIPLLMILVPHQVFAWSEEECVRYQSDNMIKIQTLHDGGCEWKVSEMLFQGFKISAYNTNDGNGSCHCEIIIMIK